MITQHTATSTSPARDGWWRQPFSVFQSNLQEIDATLDVEQALDFIQEYGADTWLINTGGIASFHPTDLPFQTRVPYLADRPSGDLIGDAVEAAHRRGVKIISRMDFSKVAQPIAAEHPEWLFVSPTGQPQTYNTLTTACPCGAYYQQRSLDILDEVIDRYPVDGFFFNWFSFSERDYSRNYHGVCHCDSCRPAFAEFGGGRPLPDGPESESYPTWLAFSAEVLARLTGRISDHIATRRPDAGLVLGRGAPIVYHEANNAFGRELWLHSTSESVSAHVTGSPDIALMVNSVSFIDMPYRMAGEQPEHFVQYLVQAIARGGNPSTYIMGAPGRIPYANLAESTMITQFHRRHRELYGILRPAAEIAVVRPNRLRSASPGYAESVEELRGLYSTLQEAHSPFDVLAVEQIEAMAEAASLGRYRVIILPDLGELPPAAATALDRWVRDGGRLVITGSSGVTDAGAVQLDTAPARMRFGSTLTGDQLWSSYVTDQPQPELGDYRYSPPIIPVYGGYARYVWKPRSVKSGQYLPQAPFGPPEKCYGHTGSADPDRVTLDSGSGSVVQLPWTIGRSYREFGSTIVRDHFRTMIDDLIRPRVTAELPEQVELFLGAAGDDLIVHLLNQSGARRRSVGPHLPISGGRLMINDLDRAPEVELLVATEPAKVSLDARTAVIELPTLDLFEVIKITL